MFRPPDSQPSLKKRRSTGYLSRPPKHYKDHLSQLPDDCLRDIFERLDFGDIDELAPLSMRMYRLTNICRPRARVIEATELLQSSQYFNFKMQYGSDDYFLQLQTDYIGPQRKMIRRAKTKEIPLFLIPQNQINSASIIQQAAIFHQRFAFARCAFDSVSIDDNFVTFLERISSARCFKYLRLLSCCFDYNLSITGRHRFGAMLLSTTPGFLTLDIDSPLPFVNEQFLEQYVQKVPFPKVAILIPETSIISPDPNFASLLSKFDMLEMPTLRVSTDWLMISVTERLRQRRSGFWKFRITRGITRQDVDFVRKPDLTFFSGDGMLVQIDLEGTPSKVMITRSWCYNGIIINASFT